MNGANTFVPLSASAIEAALQPHARAAIASVRVLEETDSTNTRLLAEPLARTGFEVLFAESQTAGRGRRGRTWHSPKGAHLYFSVSTAYRGALSLLPPLALAVGVACAEAVETVTGLPIRLKWPNDLYLEGRKLGGILIETQAMTRAPVHVVVGVGLNVRMPVEAGAGIDQPWSDLRGAPQAVDRNLLAAALLDALSTALLKFEAEGFAPFKADYARRDLLLDHAVEIHAANGETRSGRALGVDSEGALCVQSAPGVPVERLRAGEVSVRL